MSAVKNRYAELSILLGDAFDQHLGISSRTSVDEMFGNEPDAGTVDPGVFFGKSGEKVHIVVDGQLDFKVNGIVRDNDSGTLCLIQFLDKNETEEIIVAMLEQAAYLRYLTVQQTPQDCVPFYVEIVFVLAAKELEKKKELGASLKQLTNKTSYMHTIGVNILAGSECTQLNALRRAFPWRLRATKDWYDSTQRWDGEGTNGDWKLEELEVENFRVAGKRIWKPSAQRNLHVIHGYNGSGKSSICESLELLATGKIERLGERNDYDKVLTNHEHFDDGKNPAKLRASFSGNESIKGNVENFGFPESIADRLSTKTRKTRLEAAAFRMDQVMADRLSTGTAEERSNIFLQSFFPEERQKVESYIASTKTREKAAAMIPKFLMQSLEHRKEIDTALLKDLQISKKGAEDALNVLFSKVPGGATVKDLLLYSNQGSWPVIKSATKRAVGIRKLDALWDKLLDELNDWKKCFELSHEACEYVARNANEKTLERDESQQSYEVVLDNWLRSVALEDMAVREHRLLSAAEAMKTAGVETSPLSQIEPKPQNWNDSKTWDDSSKWGEAETRVSRISELQQESEKNRETLAQHSMTTRERVGGAQNQFSYTKAHAEALEQFGSLTEFGKHFEGKELNVVVEKCLDGSQSLPFEIWKDLIARARRCSEELQQFASEVAYEIPSIGSVLVSLKEFANAHAQQSSDGAEVIRKFRDLLAPDGELNRAVNELMSLMTPARWAYNDILAKSKLDSEGQSLDFEAHEGVSANLVLNTAELNTFTIALFLLCSVGTSNPLKTVVLDDPFQNMDEMTVTTVARGLNRLLRLWKKEGGGDWRLVIMLHGEENVERMFAETQCAVYSLPWLIPTNSEAKEEYSELKSDAIGELKLPEIKQVIRDKIAVDKEERSKA